MASWCLMILWSPSWRIASLNPTPRRDSFSTDFPRTVPQAEALDHMLHQRALDLDAVIELKVDEGILLKRVEKRIADMTARGEPLRADDNAEALHKRLEAYRAQTAPLIAFYARKGTLHSVDGMAEIDDVANAIERVLAAAEPHKALPQHAAEHR